MAIKIKLFLMNENKGTEPTNERKAKELSFSLAFTLFLLAITVLMGIAMCLLVFFKVDSLVQENRHDFIQQEMLSISREFQSYLSLRHKVLEDYAAFPIMVQGAMHPETNQANLNDFMNDLSILGKKLPLTLRDYEGEVLYSTVSAKDLNPFPSSLALPLISSSESNNSTPFIQVIEPINQQIPNLKLFVPILYQNLTEGYLQADIPISEVQFALELKLRSKHHRIQFKKDSYILLDLGHQDINIEKVINIASLGINIGYSTDQQELLDSRKQLVFELAMWLLGIWWLVVIISNKLGNTFLISPLEKLRSFSSNLAEGNPISMSPTTDQVYYQFTEIQDLERNFKEMVGKVTQRESSLKQAKNSLQELNDQLVEHQQQLLHSEKLASVGQLAAGVAHEINNPTGFVTGNIEVLKDYKDDLIELFDLYQSLEEHLKKENKEGEEKINLTLNKIKEFKKRKDINYIFNDIHDLINDSLDGANRIKNIVQDLKNFSRIDKVEKQLADLNEDVIETALRLVWNEIKYKCTLDKSLKPLPKYLCNPGELSQVILNLLVNACDAVGEKGLISISSEFMEDYIQIQISDDGSGISDQDLIKLFDPFFTTKEIGKGTGLGLSISHRIIEKHGGILSVASQLNVGTVFTIMLPIEENP